MCKALPPSSSSSMSSAWNVAKATSNVVLFGLGHVLSIYVTYKSGLAAYSFKDATEALAFYGVYHRDPYNQVIHFFGVPLILWTMWIYFAHQPIVPYFQWKLPDTPLHSINYATLWAIGLAWFYVSVDPIGGTLYLPIIYYGYASAIRLHAKDQLESKTANSSSNRMPFDSWMGTGKLLIWTILLHFASWYVQIELGHNYYEGAQPAVLSSLGGALTCAPLFAFYEGLWLTGINKAMQLQVLDLVANNTRQMCQSGIAMRVCETLSM